MAPSGFPTGTVSSGRTESSGSHGGARAPSDDADARTRIAELERENQALREAVERQRRENERIVERYERLLASERDGQSDTDDAAPSESRTASAGALTRLSRYLGR